MPPPDPPIPPAGPAGSAPGPDDERPDPAAGVFETLLVSDGRVPGLDAHLERLARSVRELYGLELPGEPGRRLAEWAASTSGEHRARVDAVPRDGSLHLRFVTSPCPRADEAAHRLVPVTVPGGLGRHKWCDRRLIERHSGEAVVPLLVDADETVLEAGWASFWLLEGERLITPPLDGRILPGVTRARLIGLAPGLGLTVEERPVTLAEARTAACPFLTSSLRLAVPATLAPAGPDPGPAGPDPGPAPPARLGELRAALSVA